MGTLPLLADSSTEWISYLFATIVFVSLFGALVWMACHVWITVTGRRTGEMDDPADDDDPRLCPHCGYDLRASGSRCPECGAIDEHFRRPALLKRLREEWPAESFTPRRPAADEQQVVCYETDDWVAAPLLRDQLEARGVACSRIGPTIVGRVGLERPFASHKLVVWSGDLDRAKAILDRLLAEDGAESPSAQDLDHGPSHHPQERR